MKKLILFSLLLSAIASQAVPLGHHKKMQKDNPRHYQLPADVIQQQAEHRFSRQAHKTTATMLRLVGSAYSANGMSNDSTRYKYNNFTRGSVFTTLQSYWGIFSLQTIMPDPNILFDTAYSWYNSGGGLQLFYTTINKYTGVNRIVQTDNIYPFGWYRDEATYNSSNKITDIVSSDTSNGTALIPKSHTYIFYDGQGRRTYDSSYDLINMLPLRKRVYHYDANGNLDTFRGYDYPNNKWELNYESISTYDASKRLTTQTDAADYGSGFTLQYRDSFGYTGAAMQETYEGYSYWNDNSKVWELEDVYTYHLNSSGMPDTSYYYENQPQLDTMERSIFTYNSYGLLTAIDGYEYMGNGQYASVPYDGTNLYYEEHDPESVNDVNNANATLTIYPNPATSTININATIQAATLQVVNISGQQLYTGSITNNTATVNTANWPAGTYWVMLSNDSGRIASSAFVKQ